MGVETLASLVSTGNPPQFDIWAAPRGCKLFKMVEHCVARSTDPPLFRGTFKTTSIESWMHIPDSISIGLGPQNCITCEILVMAMTLTGFLVLQTTIIDACFHTRSGQRDP